MSTERDDNSEVEALSRALKQQARAALQAFQQGNTLTGAANPLHSYAPQLFELYLAHRPGKAAIKARDTAFKMWAELGGVSHLVDDAYSHLDLASEGCSRAIARALFWSHQRDGHLVRGVAAISEMVSRTDIAGGRTPLLFELGLGHFQLGDYGAATVAMERVLSLNETAWHIELAFAEGYIREMAMLNEGQPAPDFLAQDLAGREVSLRAYRGQPVLLHFWSTGCGCSGSVLADVRQTRAETGFKRLALIGIALDEDGEALRGAIATAGVDWPQILQPGGWHGPIVRLFNITGIPRAYLIDTAGTIAYKGSFTDKLGEALRSLKD